MPRGDRFGIVHPHERTTLRPIRGGAAAIDLLAQLRAMTYGRARPIAGGRERSLAQLERETGIPARTMRRALPVLTAAGMVGRTKHGRGSCLILAPVMSPGDLACAVGQALERGDLKTKKTGCSRRRVVGQIAGARIADSGSAVRPNSAEQSGQLGRGEAPPLNQRARADFEPRENLEGKPTTTHPVSDSRQGGASDQRGVVVVEGLSPVGNIGGAIASVLGRVRRIVPEEAAVRLDRESRKAAQEQRAKGSNSQGDTREPPLVFGMSRNIPKCPVPADDLEAEAGRLRSERNELKGHRDAICGRQAGARRAWLEANPEPHAPKSRDLGIGAAVSRSGLPWSTNRALSAVLATVRPCYLTHADVLRLAPNAAAWEAMRGPGEDDAAVAVRAVEAMARECGADPVATLEDWRADKRADDWRSAKDDAFAAIAAPAAPELERIDAALEERTARLREIDRELAEWRQVCETGEAVERELAQRAATIAAAPRDRSGQSLAGVIAVLEERGYDPVRVENWALDAIPWAEKQPGGIGSWYGVLMSKAERVAAGGEIAGARLELVGLTVGAPS